MKVVVAPNSFKGSLSASEAAAAMAAGVLDAIPDAEVIEVPVADGGEGTAEALVAANHGTFGSARVEGPLGDPVLAPYGLIEDGKTAVLELAAASGYSLVPPARRDIRLASTFGFGQLLDAARLAGATSLIAGIGGSATNDAGAGMAQALGARLLDAGGRELPRGGAALAGLARIDVAAMDPAWRAVTVLVACDVTNPLTGPEGATRVYGPQKGGDPDTLKRLDAALAHFAEVVERDLGKRVGDLPGAGAAGGTGAGMIAFLNARLRPGAPLVVDASGFDRAIQGAGLIITGEGRADSQTAYGKAPGEVARRARQAGIPVLLIAGSKGPGWEELARLGVTAVVTLANEGENPQHLMQDARNMLKQAAARACRERVWK